MIESTTPERSRYGRPDDLDPRGSTDENARRQQPTGRGQRADRTRSDVPPAMRPQEDSMTNEELAQRIKAGEKDLIGQLWEQTDRLRRYFIERELIATDKAERAEAAGVAREDLLQESYFALLRAVDVYDPETGFAFSSFLKYPIKNIVNQALGLRTEKGRNDPLTNASSFDAPIGDDDDETFLRYLAVKNDPIGEATDRLYREKLREDLERSLAELPEREESLIRAVYYEGKTLEQASERIGCSCKYAWELEQEALETLRMKEALQAYREEIITRHAYHGGFQRWKDTRVSSVEEAALKLVELDERAERLDRWAALRSLK